VNQDISISSSHNNVYAHKAIAKHFYKCTKCSNVTFLMKNQFNSHIHDVYYNYFTFTYHIAVILINYIIIKTSLKTLNINVTSICLDFEVLHILVNYILTVVFISQISEILWVVKINKINDDFITNKYINFYIYIHNNDTSKIFINIKTYIVDNLNIELLIDMNVMQKKDIVLNCEKDILTLTNHHEFTALFIKTAKQNIVYYYQFQYDIFTAMSLLQTKFSYKFTLSSHQTSIKSCKHLIINNLNTHFWFKPHTISLYTHATSLSCITHNSLYNLASSHHSYLIIDNLYTQFHHTNVLSPHQFQVI